jgi:hypothetical protein
LAQAVQVVHLLDYNKASMAACHLLGQVAPLLFRRLVAVAAVQAARYPAQLEMVGQAVQAAAVDNVTIRLRRVVLVRQDRAPTVATVQAQTCLPEAVVAAVLAQQVQMAPAITVATVATVRQTALQDHLLPTQAAAVEVVDKT